MEKHELIALKKALFFIKFGNDEIEKSFLAGSPIINTLLDNIHNSLVDYYKKNIPNYSEEWGWIEDNIDGLNEVSKHLINIQEGNWNQLTDDTKIKVVTDLCHPFRVRTKTIKDMVANKNMK